MIWLPLIGELITAACACVIPGCHHERGQSAQLDAPPALGQALVPISSVIRKELSKPMQRRATSKPSDAELRQRLSALEYEVTQHEATEPPFQNRYWDNHEPGIYVDVVTGDPLFSSLSKFDSGTGWPSFSGPISSDFVVTRSDTSHGMMRIEVRSRRADSHLGHMFEDGPPPTGRRYCINSAALRFVPEAQLEAQGYGEYGTLFASRGAEHGRVPANDAAAATDSSGRTPDHEMRFSTNACTSAHDDEVAARCTATLETAILAGGCFWGMEQILRDIPGVLETEVGYTGGTTPDPTYESVSAGKTGHAEAVRIVFDPSKLSYADLLDQWFFRMHDPTTKNRQAHDVGSQYRSAIFVTTPGQLRIAEEAKRRAAESGRWRGPIVTEIVQAGKFTSAEAYHQDYLQKHPAGYSCHYLRD